MPLGDRNLVRIGVRHLFLFVGMADEPVELLLHSLGHFRSLELEDADELGLDLLGEASLDLTETGLGCLREADLKPEVVISHEELLRVLALFQ